MQDFEFYNRHWKTILVICILTTIGMIVGWAVWDEGDIMWGVAAITSIAATYFVTTHRTLPY